MLILCSSDLYNKKGILLLATKFIMIMILKTEDTRPWEIIFRQNSKRTLRWIYVTGDIFLVRDKSSKIVFTQNIRVTMKILIATDQISNIYIKTMHRKWLYT